MNTATEEIIEAIASDIQILAHLIIEDAQNIQSSRLQNSKQYENVEMKIQSLSQPVIIQILFGNYINYLEWDRPPNYGKQPPIDDLRDWALSKGISTDNETLYAIAKSIQRDGHKGRPIIATLEKEMKEAFDKEYYDKLFNSIINELIKFFN